MKILALCGSLRAASVNTALLRAAARLAAPDSTIRLYLGIGALPLFNPDLEAGDPAPVAAFRAQIMAADALLIASPEYAHGITGVLKNALDWMVGCEAFVNKPVAILNASPRATHADASLREIVTMMSAQIVEPASVTLALVGAGLDEDGIVAHPQISATLQAALAALQAHLLASQA